MLVQKGRATLAAQFEQPFEKLTLSVVFARSPEPAHLHLGIDAVDEDSLEPSVVVESGGDQSVDESDGAHLAHEAGIEAERVDAIQDRLRASGRLVDLYGIDHDEHHIGPGAVENHREDRRVPHVAAVPIILAVNLDSLKQGWQAGGGKHGIDAHVGMIERAQPVGHDVAGADKELHLAGMTQLLEVDLCGENFAQRMAAGGIELIR